MRAGSHDYQKLANKIILLDKSIRYCGIVDQLGEILAQDHRTRLNPILTINDWNRRALHFAIRYSQSRSWEEHLGRLQYHVSRYDKIITAAVRIGNHHLLIVSFDHDTEYFDKLLTKRIIPLLEDYRLIVH